MKRKTKKTNKSPQRSLPSYLEEFAVLLRKKAEGSFHAMPIKSPSSKQMPTVVEQIASILRKQARAKAEKKVAVKTRKPRRVKK